MNTLLVIIVIISSVVAIDNFDTLKNFCEGSDVPGSDLADIVKGHSSELSVGECQHSVGFYFNTDSCQSLRVEHKTNAKNFSAFLSNDEIYLYVYITVTKRMVIEEKPQTIVLDINKGINILGSFGGWSSSLQNSSFVVWLKEKRITDSTLSYRIDYNYKQSDQKSVTTEKLMTRTDTQILITNNRSNNKFAISFASKDDEYKYSLTDRVSIRDSYFIICAQKYKDTKFYGGKCRPILKEKEILCECSYKKSKTNYSLFALTLFYCALAVVSIKPLMETFVETKRGEKTVFYLHHNCSERNYKFKYVFVIRFTKSNPDIDLRNVSIDVQFLGEGNLSVAPAYRFRAKALDTNLVTDIKLIVSTLTKMAELKQIQCSHSGKQSDKIILLGVFKKGLIGDNPENMVYYKLAKNITRNPRRFNLHPHKEGQDITEAEDRPIRSLSLLKINFSQLILLFLLFIDISFIILISILIDTDYKRSTFTPMLVNIAKTTLSSIAFMALMILCFKSLLMVQMKQQMRMNFENERSIRVVIWVSLIALFVLTFSANIYAVTLIDDKPFIDIYRLVAITVISTALTAFVWYLYSLWEYYHLKRQSLESSVMTVNSASVNDSTFD